MATWHDAKDICMEMSASLVKIHTESESDYITEKIVDFDFDDIWIGATDEEEEGIWM